MTWTPVDRCQTNPPAGSRNEGDRCGRASVFKILAGLPLLAAACARSDRPRSLLLVTFDTTRADRLGAYGGAADVSPNLDALAREGALFESAYSPVPMTLPSHATILTGLEPPAHGAHGNGQILPGDVTNLAGRLSAAGFATAAFLGSSVLDPSTGLARGFEVYDSPRYSSSGGTRAADETTSRAISWLGAVPAGRRFFLWVHYFDPHDPYAPPEPWDGRFRGRAYEGEIAFADAELARLLEPLRRSGRLEETLVCVTADHGEALGEHEEPTHGLFLYEATARVPLLFRHPPSIPVVRVRGIARLVDVAPTLLDLVGLPLPPDFQGRSLAPSLRAGRIDPALPAYLESEILLHLGGAPLRAIRTEEWKFERAPRPELYRPEEDPAEARNLFESHPEIARELDRRLADLERRIGERARRAPEDPRAEPALVALGYISASLPKGSLPGLDPKDYYPILARASNAVSSLERGRPDAEVLGELERALPGGRERAFASLHVALSFAAKGRLDVAGAWVERTLRLRPDLAVAHLLDARLAASRGETARAEEILRETVRLHPTFTEARLRLAQLLVYLSRGAEAEPLLRGVLREWPSSFGAWEALAKLLGAEPARRAEAVEALEEAVRLSPDPAQTRALLEKLAGEAPAPARGDR
ncbi:MAG TPA: sulfatase-like hydrolase/transferase [Planctomycetota bacterium]|jgi:arylsulfatase A-like enzyme|nr:sulfatase-like hydrolase/transferase [Planctomycetota bacterium]